MTKTPTPMRIAKRAPERVVAEIPMFETVEKMDLILIAQQLSFFRGSFLTYSGTCL